MIRKSGAASRVADLKIDEAARVAAIAVRGAASDGAGERFLNRFCDYLHTVDDENRGLAPLDYSDLNSPRRRRRRPD